MRKNEESKKVVSSEEVKEKLKKEASLDSITFVGNYRPATNLGDGRWQYKGKTYKEESL